MRARPERRGGAPVAPPTRPQPPADRAGTPTLWRVEVMPQHVVMALALAGACLIVIAGFGHLARPAELADALAAHDVLGATWRRRVHPVLGAFESSTGLAVVLAWLSGMDVRGPLWATATLYGAFAAYLTRVVRHRPGVPCGCFGTDEPAGRLAQLRATVLALACAAAAVAPAALPALAERCALLGAGLVLAGICWLAPMLGPAADPGGDDGPRTDGLSERPTPPSAPRRTP